MRETHQMTGPQLTQNLQPFTSCSQRKQNIKPTLKSHAQFQWMQMTDRHLLTTLRASSPTFSGTRARGISYDTLGLSPNSVFPKGFSSMSRMTQESCFTEITNCKLFFFFFFNKNGVVKDLDRNASFTMALLNKAGNFCRLSGCSNSEVHFLSLIHSIN